MSKFVSASTLNKKDSQVSVTKIEPVVHCGSIVWVDKFMD